MNTSPNLHIAEPCHENWQSMTSAEQGRHCDKCCKVVTDFTTMPTEKIIDFLKEKKEGSVCGRFRAEQINERVEARIVSPKSRYRIFFAALVFVFGGMLFTSCKTSGSHEVMGKVAQEHSFEGTSSGFVSDSPTIISRAKIDTTKWARPVKQKPVCKVDTIEQEHFIMGEYLYIPPDTTQNK